MRGVEIGQSKSGAAERKPAGGAGGWQTAAESWDVLPDTTNAAAPDTPVCNSSETFKPYQAGGKRSGTKRASFGGFAARKSVAYFCSNFLSLCPIASEYHR